MTNHLIIPDVQSKPGVDLSHMDWIGQYIVDKQPEVIVCIGDFADMESLSSYDKGKLSFEGRRYKKDIDSATEAMDRLLAPMKAYNKNKAKTRHKQYKPRMVLTLGNHEARIMRVVNDNPELDGFMSYDDLPYKDWEVHGFLEPVVIGGVLYSHYMANPMSGRPYGGAALNILKQVGRSFIVGHAQKLDICTRFLPTGEQQWAVVAGACYLHDEDYKGPQGNPHWRGIVYIENVVDGNFDQQTVSLDSLKLKYS